MFFRVCGGIDNDQLEWSIYCKVVRFTQSEISHTVKNGKYFTVFDDDYKEGIKTNDGVIWHKNEGQQNGKKAFIFWRDTFMCLLFNFRWANITQSSI